MLQSARGHKDSDMTGTHGPQAITQAMESSEMIRMVVASLPVVGALLSQGCANFLLCTDQDAGWTSLLPYSESAYSSWGLSADSCGKDSEPAENSFKFPSASRDCGPTLERTISVLSAGTMGAATDASHPRDAPSCSPC